MGNTTLTVVLKNQLLTYVTTHPNGGYFTQLLVLMPALTQFPLNVRIGRLDPVCLFIFFYISENYITWGFLVYRLGEALVHLKVALVDKDGKAPSQKFDNRTAFINNIGTSIFSDVKIKLNAQEVHQRSNNYHYRRYIEQLISFDDLTKKSTFQAQGYFEDGAGTVSKVLLNFNEQVLSFCSLFY